jgi:hypothetical protein
VLMKGDPIICDGKEFEFSHEFNGSLFARNKNNKLIRFSKKEIKIPEQEKMTTKLMNTEDDVIYKGKKGVVRDSFRSIVTVKFTDGSVKDIHESKLTKLEDYKGGK